jgi:hypothetical protein
LKCFTPINDPSYQPISSQQKNKTMKQHKSFIEIPEKLQPDAFQPYSITPHGEWVEIGTATIPGYHLKDKALSKLALSFYGDSAPSEKEVQHPGLEKVKALKELLDNVHKEGYTLRRAQRFEVVDQVGIPAYHSDQNTSKVVLGVQYDQEHHDRGIDVLGLNLGVQKISETKMGINATPMFRDKDISQVPYQSPFVETEEEEVDENETEEAGFDILDLALNNRELTHEDHEKNSNHLRADLQLGWANETLIEELHGQEMTFLIYGQDTGARYVVYQLVDRMTITRNQDLDGIDPIIFEAKFRHTVFVARYAFED